MHLSQRRVHHDDKTDGDGDGCAPIEALSMARPIQPPQVAGPHTDADGQKDRQRQAAVKEPGAGELTNFRSPRCRGFRSGIRDPPPAS